MMAKFKIYPHPIIGDNLRAMCAEKGISAKQLTATCGKDRKTAYSWFNGASSPTAEDIRRICERYHVSADELLGLKVGD